MTGRDVIIFPVILNENSHFRPHITKTSLRLSLDARFFRSVLRPGNVISNMKMPERSRTSCVTPMYSPVAQKSFCYDAFGLRTLNGSAVRAHTDRQMGLILLTRPLTREVISYLTKAE